MLLLWPDDAGMPRAMTLLFGTGLVGGAIADALRLAGFHGRERQLYDWSNRGGRMRQSDEIAARVRAARPERIDIIWAGGTSGFQSDAYIMDEETTCLREILSMARGLCAGPDGIPGRVHLISSAGGLFEGQTQCGATSTPSPIRAYGIGKLAQETLLQEVFPDRWIIYRLSSVYGYVPRGRAGLITTLVRNALCWRTTRIFGSLVTIRDYVLATDIGRFVAANVVAEDATNMTYLLASGRPAAMSEVLKRVEEALEMALLVQYDPYPHNARNMSFLPSALPPAPGWQPTPLANGIRQTAAAMRNASVSRVP